MKLLTALVILTVLFQTTGQIKKDLQSIKTEQEAKAYLTKAKLKGSVLELDEIRDSSAAALKLFHAGAGEIIEIKSSNNTYLYKTLTSTQSEVDRVQYIFFDNSKLKKKQIDSLRNIVMKRIKAGEKFGDLAGEFSMDPNGQRGGDLGWYDRTMFVQGFVKAVQSHKKGDVFLVDLPAEKWYYVVRKSHDPKKRKQIKAFYVTVPTN